MYRPDLMDSCQYYSKGGDTEMLDYFGPGAYNPNEEAGQQQEILQYQYTDEDEYIELDQDYNIINLEAIQQEFYNVHEEKAST